MKENWDNKWSQVIKSTLDDYQAEVPSTQWLTLQNKILMKSAIKLSFKAAIGFLAISSVTLFTILQLTDTKTIPSETTSIQSNLDEPITIINRTIGFSALIIDQQDTIPSSDDETDECTLNKTPASSNTVKERDALTEINNKELDTNIKNSETPKLELIIPLSPVQNTKQKSQQVKINFGIGGGLISKKTSWNGFANLHSQLTRKKWSLYTGINYSSIQFYKRNCLQPNYQDTLTIQDTTKYVNSNMHQLSIYGGIKYSFFQVKSKKFYLNTGAYKTFYLNRSINLDNTIKWNNGVEMETMVLKKYRVSFYYSILIPIKSDKKADHMVGIRLNL